MEEDFHIFYEIAEDLLTSEEFPLLTRVMLNYYLAGYYQVGDEPAITEDFREDCGHHYNAMISIAAQNASQPDTKAKSLLEYAQHALQKVKADAIRMRDEPVFEGDAGKGS